MLLSPLFRPGPLTLFPTNSYCLISGLLVERTSARFISVNRISFHEPPLGYVAYTNSFTLLMPSMQALSNWFPASLFWRITDMLCSSTPCVPYCYQPAPANFHVPVSDIMSSAGCGSGTRFSSELMTNTRLLSLYDCSVHLISFGSADIDQLTCHTASCRPHPHACFSCNGTIGVLLSERGPSPLLTCCCCFYDCDSWYSAHMGTVL